MNQEVLAQKKETVAELNELLKNSHSTIVVSYSGLAVDEVNQLRHDLKQAGARLSVHKNTLLRKAVDEDGLSSLDECLKGPTAIVTSAEEGAGLSVLKNFADSHAKKFSIKGGVIDGTYCDADTITSLAAIGTRDNAIAVLLSSLQAPVVLFACALKEIAEKQQA